MTEDAMSGSGQDGVSAETLRSISTPDRVESRLGTLEFRDGAPTKATAELLYDHLDFVHGMQAFINAFPGASWRPSAGVPLDRGAGQLGLVVLGADGLGVAVPDRELRHGLLPQLRRPDRRAGGARRAPARPAAGILGTIDDMWFRWVTDFGLPGPDRAQGAGT
jgi:hypothetical protein